MGSSCDLAMDASGHLHASYTDATRALRYAYYDGSTWFPETVESIGPCGGGTFIAVDSGGRPHIYYIVTVRAC